jgi:predicted transcriptional regulator
MMMYFFCVETLKAKKLNFKCNSKLKKIKSKLKKIKSKLEKIKSRKKFLIRKIFLIIF